jgi:hypothetical protein
MQTYGMKIDLLTNATVVEIAVQFVERYRSNRPLNSMPQILKVGSEDNIAVLYSNDNVAKSR